MAETDIVFPPETLTIGAAMPQSIGHAFQVGVIHRLSVAIPDSRQTAHAMSFLGVLREITRKPSLRQ